MPTGCGKRPRPWQGGQKVRIPDRRSVRVARNGNLAGRAVHELRSRKLLDKIGIGGAGFHQRDAVFEPPPGIPRLSQLLAVQRERRLNILVGLIAARPVKEVVAEIGCDGERDGREHQRAEEASNTPPDSHAKQRITDGFGRSSEILQPRDDTHTKELRRRSLRESWRALLAIPSPEISVSSLTHTR